jgi:hypothetical protein
VLLHVHSATPNRPHEPAARLFPMKHLAGIERLLQIKIGRCKLG